MATYPNNLYIYIHASVGLPFALHKQCETAYVWQFTGGQDSIHTCTCDKEKIKGQYWPLKCHMTTQTDSSNSKLTQSHNHRHVSEYDHQIPHATHWHHTCHTCTGTRHTHPTPKLLRIQGTTRLFGKPNTDGHSWMLLGLPLQLQAWPLQWVGHH